MKIVTLGATGLEVTPIAYGGTWQFGGDWGPVDEEAAVSAIGHARSRGVNFLDVNFFDTAQAYGFGRSGRLLGRALAADLRAARSLVVMATKGGLRMDGDRLVRDAGPPGCAKVSRRAWRRCAPITSTRTRCTGPTRPHRSLRRQAR